MVREMGVQSQVESYQRLKKWYLMPPCLALKRNSQEDLEFELYQDDRREFICYVRGRIRLSRAGIKINSRIHERGTGVEKNSSLE